MTQPKTKYKIGASPRKLALIAVLGVVQVIVILRQLPEPASLAARATPTNKPTRSVAPGATATENSTTEAIDGEAKPWPEFSLESAIVNNPFAKPPWSQPNKPDSAAEQDPINPEALTELQQLGASIVVIAGAEKAATIGTQEVHVGDIIDGYRITDITTRGVVLKELAPR